MNQDPIGFEAGDANLYRYAGNGPTNATDPSGLKVGIARPPRPGRLPIPSDFPRSRPSPFDPPPASSPSRNPDSGFSFPKLVFGRIGAILSVMAPTPTGNGADRGPWSYPPPKPKPWFLPPPDVVGEDDVPPKTAPVQPPEPAPSPPDEPSVTPNVPTPDPPRPGGPNSADDLAEGLRPEEYDGYGPPEDWQYVGPADGDGALTYSPNYDVDTVKRYDIYRTPFGDEVHIHSVEYPDGSREGHRTKYDDD